MCLQAFSASHITQPENNSVQQGMKRYRYGTRHLRIVRVMVNDMLTLTPNDVISKPGNGAGKNVGFHTVQPARLVRLASTVT